MWKHSPNLEADHKLSKISARASHDEVSFQGEPEIIYEATSVACLLLKPSKTQRDKFCSCFQ